MTWYRERRAARAAESEGGSERANEDTEQIHSLRTRSLVGCRPQSRDLSHGQISLQGTDTGILVMQGPNLKGYSAFDRELWPIWAPHSNSQLARPQTFLGVAGRPSAGKSDDTTGVGGWRSRATRALFEAPLAHFKQPST